MDRSRALVGGVALVAALTASWHARADSSSFASAGAEYDLATWNGSPYIDLVVEGASGRFLFDTGANTSGIDASWLRAEWIPYYQGMPETLSGTTGVFTVSTAILDRLELGHGYFPEPSFIIEDLSAFGSPGGRPEAGILGMDFLSAFAVTLDLAHGKAALALESERPEPAPDEWGVALDLATTRVPTVPATICGVAVPCRLDTGTAYFDPRPFVDVNQATVDALERDGIVLVQTGSVGVSGVSGFESLPLYEGAPWAGPLGLTIGPVNVSGVVLVVHDQGSMVQSAPVALAGAPVLSRLGSFRLDPFAGKLWIAPR